MVQLLVTTQWRSGQRIPGVCGVVKWLCQGKMPVRIRLGRFRWLHRYVLLVSSNAGHNTDYGTAANKRYIFENRVAGSLECSRVSEKPTSKPKPRPPIAWCKSSPSFKTLCSTFWISLLSTQIPLPYRAPHRLRRLISSPHFIWCSWFCYRSLDSRAAKYFSYCTSSEPPTLTPSADSHTSPVV